MNAGRMRWRWLVLVAVLAAVAPAPAVGQAPPLPAASPEAALRHVQVLAGQIGPRVAGGPGELRGADYIAADLQRAGHPIERQAFPILYFEETAAPVLTVLAPAAGSLAAVSMIYSSPTPPEGIEAEVVPAGLGRPEDFQGRAVGGRIALIERGELLFRQKVANAAAAGAAAVILFNNQPGGPIRGTLDPSASSAVPAVMVSQDDGRRLLELARAGPLRVRLVVRTLVEPRPSLNVIGVKRGSGRPEEIVVVGGHMDSVEDSPGANDNASGVAATLEAARLLAGVPTVRTIHFVGFGAEEIGLRGSEFYVQHVRGRVVGMINMDMVGRGSLAAGGPAGGPSLVEAALRAAARLGLRLPTFATRGGSDHAPFAAARIPVVFLHTGADDAHHTPADTPDRISADLLARAAAVAAAVALEVANAR